MIYLKEANFEDIEKEWQYIAAMPEDENGLTNQWPDISREDFEKTALPEIINHSKGIDMPDEVERLKTASAVFLTPSNRTRATSGSAQVAETFLFLWDDDTIVGLFRLRQYLNDALREGSGHIGYGIGKEYRGKGYGTKGLALTLEYGKNIIPEDEFYLRVNKDNPASLKVMIKNGGRIVGENDEKYFVRIKK